MIDLNLCGRLGTENRKIGHTLTIEGLDLIAKNLGTVVELAKLEKGSK